MTLFEARRPRALLPALLGTLLAACGPEDAHVRPATSTPTVDVLEFAALSARNVLIRWTPIENGTVTIERAREEGPFERVAQRPAHRGRFLDLALEPLTTYRYRLGRCDGTTCGQPEPLGQLTTPATRIQPFEVEGAPGGTEDDLVVFGVSALDPDILDTARMVAVDRQGTVVWEYVREGPYLAPVTEVHLLDDGTLATGHNASFVQLDLDGTELFRYEGNTAHHDIDPISGDRFIFLTFDFFADAPGEPVVGDGIEIIHAGAQHPSWSWLARDHIPRTDRHPFDWNNFLFGIGHDWTHANAVTFDEEAGKIYLNVRNLDRLYCIDYPSGEVLWVMGQGGDFGEGLWAHSHDPTFVADDRFLMFDNGALRAGTNQEYSRIIEVEFDADERRADIVWEYRESPDFYAFAQGAVSVQPNGNIFVTDGVNTRIFEVTRDKELVWQLRLLDGAWTYKAITVPRSVFTDW
ncbi:MAG: aryl-sulfate sulfotransferase [Myxococcota bacterium]